MPDELKDTPRHTIRVAARRTGLTAATLRAWERRYGAVTPARSGTERRLYSDADLERLRLMRELAGQGHSVGQLARLSPDELRALTADERATAGTLARVDADTAAPAGAVSVALCEVAVRAMDAPTLNRLLMRAIVERGPDTFVEHVAAPLCWRIGEEWEAGTLSVAHEHVASTAIRHALGFLLDTLRPDADVAPRLVATTPAAQRHEFGAMMVAIIAAAAGWQVTYLGADVPAADIATAVRSADASVLALSIVTRGTGEDAAPLLADIRAAVGPRVRIVAGGRAVDEWAAPLRAAGASVLPELAAVREYLAPLGAEPRR